MRVVELRDPPRDASRTRGVEGGKAVARGEERGNNFARAFGTLCKPLEPGAKTRHCLRRHGAVGLEVEMQAGDVRFLQKTHALRVEPLAHGRIREKPLELALVEQGE